MPYAYSALVCSAYETIGYGDCYTSLKLYILANNSASYHSISNN